LTAITKIDGAAILKNFSDFGDVNKILGNYVVPYFDLTTGYYSWDPCNINGIQGSIISIDESKPVTNKSKTKNSSKNYKKFIVLDHDVNKRDFELLSIEDIETEFVKVIKPNGKDLSFSFTNKKGNKEEKNLYDGSMLGSYYYYYYQKFRDDVEWHGSVTSQSQQQPQPKANSDYSYTNFQKWLVEKKSSDLRVKLKNASGDKKRKYAVEYGILNSIIVENENTLKSVMSWEERLSSLSPWPWFNNVTKNFKIDKDTMKVMEHFLSDIGESEDSIKEANAKIKESLINVSPAPSYIPLKQQTPNIVASKVDFTNKFIKMHQSKFFSKMHQPQQYHVIMIFLYLISV
jgi:hypothetical protein